MIATKAKSTQALSRTQLEMIEACGRICQILGLPRSLGSIYGLLYLASEPFSLDQIADLLGISKASASNGTRQLAAWGGIRQVWVPGERRDHFQVEPELSRLLRSGYMDFLKPRLRSSEQRVRRLVEALDDDLNQGLVTREAHKLWAERLRQIVVIQKKLQDLAPLAERLF